MVAYKLTDYCTVDFNMKFTDTGSKESKAKDSYNARQGHRTRISNGYCTCSYTASALFRVDLI